MSELLALRITADADPDEGIRLFNSCLRDAQRLQALPEDAVKRQFLAALSDEAYSTLIDSFARVDQRAAVSLLTLQARVREQYRHGRLSGARLKQSAARPVSAASYAADPDLASAIQPLGLSWHDYSVTLMLSRRPALLGHPLGSTRTRTIMELSQFTVSE
ncbi:hypothetical protein CYMTET_37633 [Cymbomonas tetramitiformis]|uniref:Uncharacterized protein n=1 Tax=Cymbomonas tetramitiformis TaxID=36881 RepID=A0AAE0CF19_9CHLO|nr:hypothetical protein CYMTET_37633 [Cymbomonas tetramitiformis]